MPNIEIKAKYPELAIARAIATKINAHFVGEDRQTDTYFRTLQGRLKLRESSISGAQLIPYLRSDETGPKKSEYLVVPVTNAELCKRLLGSILGIEVVVRKTRQIYLIGNIRVHLDDVEELGQFLEFEAVYDSPSQEVEEYRKVQALMKTFLIEAEALVSGSYREMALAQKAV